uniref:Uncharacterized protein n=1 Tax=Arundo donax TaxID=35708 RepID=A0A0A9EDY3_ARUDO
MLSGNKKMLRFKHRYRADSSINREPNQLSQHLSAKYFHHRIPFSFTKPFLGISFRGSKQTHCC